ncbi:epoxyqueuosine reductase [Bacteroidia bacterium]|nr:epoxyqueuosine reductase [Bacteroidia bacterium]
MILNTLEQNINHLAQNIGFVACGITKAEPMMDELRFFEEYLSEGRNAKMIYLGRNLNKRLNPELLFEGVQSAVVLLDKIPQNCDYHSIMRTKVNLLIAEMKIIFPEADFRGFVDTAPVLEKSLAIKAGLGWRGKNTLLINEKFGAKTNIAVIFTNALFDNYSTSYNAHNCNNCTRCIDACPTHALIAPYKLDARLCLAYTEFGLPRMRNEKTDKDEGNCNICRNVCPFS